MTRSFVLVCALGCTAACITTACQTVPRTETDRKTLATEVQTAISDAKANNPKVAGHFKDCYAYAVLPKVGKGGLVFAGAYGRGEVYEKGKMIGYCDLNQGSFGAQIGGQSFNEFIFFQNAAALKKFTSGQFAPAANASAAGGDAGSAVSNDYQDGVAVFITGVGGLMAEASVGGQQFNFTAMDAVKPGTTSK
ncbi:MAG: hypothetical protein U0636_04045 [Phycisphaerales bacterium]